MYAADGVFSVYVSASMYLTTAQVLMSAVIQSTLHECQDRCIRGTPHTCLDYLGH